jgi:hypothetical protein
VSKSQVDKLDEAGRMKLGEKLVSHAKGPMLNAVEYKRYMVNGVLYHTLDVDEEKTSQNSGVCLTIEDGPTYYVKLARIIKVTYYDLTRYVLFKCDWANIQPNKGYKKDEYGFDLLNFKNLIHTGAGITDDQFVLPNQVSQVYYVQDPKHPNWVVVAQNQETCIMLAMVKVMTMPRLTVIMSTSLSTLTLRETLILMTLIVRVLMYRPPKQYNNCI